MRIPKGLVVVALFLAIFSCKKNTDTTETDNLFRFRDYISYTTSGVVSVADNIRVNLASPVEGWEINQEITDKIFTLKPHVSGKVIVNSPQSFEFFPDEPLDPATEYTATVKLGKLYPNIDSKFQDYTFQFKTITPNFNIVTTDLQSYSKQWQYLGGTIKSADVITLDQAKKLVEAFQDNSNLKIEWNEALLKGKVFEFKIDSIKRKIDDADIVVKWNGKAINAENSGENTVNIPGQNNFTITDIDVTKSPEQFLSINFSDPLKKQQNFQGLVSIENVKNPRFIVDGNVLKIYPDARLIGNIDVEVFQGIKNTDGYKLKKPFSETVSFEDVKPELKLIGNGTILPNSEDLRFNFEAVNLKAVDVRIIKIFEDNVLQFLQDNNLDSNNGREIRQVGRRIAKKTINLLDENIADGNQWRAYSIDLKDVFTADPGAIYRVELSIKKEYSLYNCEANPNINNSEEYEDYYEDEYYEDDYYYDDYSEEMSEDEELREEQYWDNLTYSYKNRGYYPYRDRNNPCKEAYYENQTLSKNLIASNLGVIAKKGTEGKYHFAVTNILNTNPENGAKVTIYNFQQQAIASTQTNSEGLAEIDSKKHANFAIINKGTNTTYVKLSDGLSLSLSKFDVSGNYLQRGLKGYMYGERGVWRPGDTLHLSFMLNDNGNKLPAGHPVKLEVTDPVGKLVYKDVTKDNLNNLYVFTVPTAPEYKTGNYSAKVSVGGAQFYEQLKIETVKPNRLKIKVDFEDKILSSTKPLNAKLKVNWLHGAPGKNLKTELKAKFTNDYSGFKNFPKYVFRDPTRHFYSEELNIFEDQVNEDGEATIDTQLDVGKNAPGLLKVQFLARAFENGGDFSLNAFTKTYAPYKSFVGMRSPEGRAYGSFFTNEDQTFDIVTVDDQGNPIKRNGLEVKVYQIKWRWWWNSSRDNLSSYTSSSYHKPYKTFKLNTNSSGKANFTLNIPEDDKGRYLIRVYDPKSGHATGRTAYFYKNWYVSPDDKENAKMLVFSADKENYNVGDQATIKFPSGSDGRALISIENGSGVLEQRWVKTQKGESEVKLPITADMAPNVFVNISLLQPHAISANDLPIRLYGIIPLMVENPTTKLTPEIKMPETLKPEQTFEVKVSEKNNKAMTYTLAVVEEGLLDLTNFKTPNPWKSFYQREALGVKTWDVFDDVIGAYSGSVEQVFAIGGDGEAESGADKKKANRFKPVVKFLGPFVIKAGDEKTHSITLPNYVGSVRTMVVASNNKDEAYGGASVSTPVKKPLMVLATLPRRLSPGEKVTLPVTVFAMEPKVKNVNISLKLSNGIEVVGNKTQALSFAKPDEKMAFFELDVSKANGINMVEVIAKGNGETSTYKVELDVENPNPYTSKFHDTTLEPNATQTVTFDAFGVEGTNSAVVEFSTLPPMDFSRRLQYLVQYPHGCVEQTTSSVFPQLFMTDIFDLPFKQKQDIEQNIKDGIKRLGHFQRPNGGMSYWIGEPEPNDWGTSYAGHFMIEAEKKGYVLPLTFKSNWISYQQQASREWRPSYKSYNSDLAQAYRLYTLALAGKPDLASMNRLREFSEISNEAKWRLALAYALAGQTEASKQVMATANIEFKPPRSNSYTYGSVDRNRAMALETMVFTKDNRARDLAKLMAKDLSSNRWMSTQTTAYSLLAMGKMVGANGGKSIKLTFSANGENGEVNTKNAIAQRNLKVKQGTNTVNITNKEGNVVFVRVLNTGKLPLGSEIAEQRGLSASVVYKNLDGQTIDISELKQGDDFVATVTVSNTKNEYVSDIALTQIFPSGWEIVNTRFTDFGSTTTSQARHTDIRDDRVNFYFDLPKRGKYSTKTFNVMLNASYLGKYYLPGIQAEAMYDNEYLVRTKGQWVEIVK